MPAEGRDSPSRRTPPILPIATPAPGADATVATLAPTALALIAMFVPTADRTVATLALDRSRSVNG